MNTRLSKKYDFHVSLLAAYLLSSLCFLVSDWHLTALPWVSCYLLSSLSFSLWLTLSYLGLSIQLPQSCPLSICLSLTDCWNAILASDSLWHLTNSWKCMNYFICLLLIETKAVVDVVSRHGREKNYFYHSWPLSKVYKAKIGFHSFWQVHIT